MTHIPNEQRADAKERDAASNSEQRTSKAPDAVEMASAFGLPAQGLQMQERAATPGNTLPPPPGLGPKGVPDQRFAMKWKTSVPEAMRVMTEYFKALNARNLQGMAELCQFPFATIEQVTPVVVKSADDLIAHAPASMNMSENPERWTDHDSFIKHGSYDTFNGIEILAQDPYVVNLAMVYNRYGSDGKMLLQCQGVYCVTCNNNKWGIELMSTIFTPAPLVGKRYPATEEAGLRARIIHDLGPNTNNSEDDGYDYQFGPQASISGSDGFIPLEQNADAGNAMKTYRTQGIKSRLRLGEGKPGVNSDAGLNIRESGGNPNNPTDVTKYKDDWHWYRAMYDQLGLGRWGFTIGLMPYSRVVHAGQDKAHVFSGLTRYNTVGEEINTSSEMSIVTWKAGRWGKAGAGAYITMHDRANDVGKINS